MKNMNPYNNAGKGLGISKFYSLQDEMISA
jgi:hypothetical protein